MDHHSVSLANLVATIDSVAVGDATQEEDDHDTEVVTTEDLLEGAVLHLSNGQSMIVEMPTSLEDAINVVQVETTLGDDGVTTVEEMCEMEIDSEEKKRILSETGAHVVVKTASDDTVLGGGNSGEERPSIVLPTIPFSFPGQTFDTKCQKLILNVWDFFRRVKKNPDLLDEIRTPQERAAAALHISAATIGKIGKNFKRTGKLETPGKKRNRTKPVVDSVDDEQEEVIRTIIKDFKTNRITPTLPLILNECRERINFQGGATSFRRILQRMGYKGLSAKTSIPSTSASKSKSFTVSAPSPSKPTTPAFDLAKMLKNIKKEPTFISLPAASVSTSTPNLTFRPLISPRPVVKQTRPPPVPKQSPSRVITNLFGENFLQLGTNAKGEAITISQQTAAAIASASAKPGEGPQTIHVLQPDNSVQQIQIVYANFHSNELGL